MSDASSTIHVVDDDMSFRNSVARLLRVSGYEVKAYESGRVFLESGPQTTPGCILLDMKMADLNGLELQQHLGKSGNPLPVIFLTAHGDIAASVQAIKAGAEDFLSKPVAKKALIEAVERGVARYWEQRRKHDQMTAMRDLVAALTPRENEVFKLVVSGKLNKQIAHELGTSERTIKAHRHAVMEKLRVDSLAEAVTIAERLGLLSNTESLR